MRCESCIKAFERYKRDCHGTFQVGVFSTEDWLESDNMDSYFPIYDESNYPSGSSEEYYEIGLDIELTTIASRSYFSKVILQLEEIEEKSGYEAACKFAEDSFE